MTGARGPQAVPSGPLLKRRQLLEYAGATTALTWLTGCGTEQAVSRPLSAQLLCSIVGNPQPDGFTVSTRTSGTTGVRLRVEPDAGRGGRAIYTSLAAPDVHGWTKVSVTGLDPGTAYTYDVELTDAAGSRLSNDHGSARTLPDPGSPASFAFAFGSCMASGSDNRDVMDRILERDPLLFLHLGDFGYFDNPSPEETSHREDFEGQLAANAGLREVLANIPTFYVQSDHDGGGGNNAGPGPWTPANRAAYRQVFPHPDVTGHEDGMYWSVVVGRVRLIFTDHKTYSSPAADADTPSKSMMGSAQKSWFKSELRSPQPVKIWVQHSPFVLTEAGGDTWANYPAERSELAAFIRDQAFGEVVTISGDMHAVAVSETNEWGLRSWSAAPFHQRSSYKDGPWTSGPFPDEGESARQYGYVEVTDRGDAIDVVFDGYDSDNDSLISDTLTVTVAR